MVVTDSHTTYYTFNCIVFRVCNFVFAAVRVNVWLLRVLKLAGMTISKRLQVRSVATNAENQAAPAKG